MCVCVPPACVCVFACVSAWVHSCRLFFWMKVKKMVLIDDVTNCVTVLIWPSQFIPPFLLLLLSPSLPLSLPSFLHLFISLLSYPSISSLLNAIQFQCFFLSVCSLFISFFSIAIMFSLFFCFYHIFHW